MCAQKHAELMLTVWVIQHYFSPDPFHQENHLHLLKIPCSASLGKCLFNKENPGVQVKYYD